MPRQVPSGRTHQRSINRRIRELTIRAKNSVQEQDSNLNVVYELISLGVPQKTREWFIAYCLREWRESFTLHFGFNLVIDIAKLGVSKKTRTAVVKGFAEHGFYNHAEQAAQELLNRYLTRDEVMSLAKNIFSGASRSDHEDNVVLGLARRHLDSLEDLEDIIEMKRARDRRWRDELD